MGTLGEGPLLVEVAATTPRRHDGGSQQHYDAPCEGTPARNGFYGNGIVDALSAVTG